MNATRQVALAALCGLLLFSRTGRACSPCDITIPNWLRYISPGDPWEFTAERVSGAPIRTWSWSAGGWHSPIEWTSLPDESRASVEHHYELGGWYVWAHATNEDGRSDEDYGIVWVFKMHADIAGLSEETEEDPGFFMGVGDTVTLSLSYEPSTLYESGQTQRLLAYRNPGPVVKVYEGATVIIDAVNTSKVWYLEQQQPREVLVEGWLPGVTNLYHEFRLEGNVYPGSCNNDCVKVTVVGVGEVDMKPSESYPWCSFVTGQGGHQITVLKGTKYPFFAKPLPANATWPWIWPLWWLDGVEVGAGPGDPNNPIEITFDSAGTKTLDVFCGYCDPGVQVTVHVVEASVYQFGVSGTQTLYPTPREHDGWADANLPPFGNPIYDSLLNYDLPVCVMKNSNEVSLTDVKLIVPQALTYGATIRVDANGTEDWCQSAPVAFSGTTSTSATLPITGNIINRVWEYCYDFEIQWKYKVPDGTNTWYPIGTTQHVVHVVYGVPAEGISATEKRIQRLCQDCNGCSDATQCSDRIHAALAATPPGLLIPADRPENLWWMMDPNGPDGACVDLADLMSDMYHLLGCPGGEVGFVFATSDPNCYSTDPSAYEKRTCGSHGSEVLSFFAGSYYNMFEAVFHVNGKYYPVKGTPEATALAVLRNMVGDNTLESGHWQAWISFPGLSPCGVPGPIPVPLP